MERHWLTFGVGSSFAVPLQSPELVPALLVQISHLDGAAEGGSTLSRSYRRLRTSVLGLYFQFWSRTSTLPVRLNSLLNSWLPGSGMVVLEDQDETVLV